MRDYDPETGRWTAIDRIPFAGGVSMDAIIDGNVYRQVEGSLARDDASPVSHPALCYGGGNGKCSGAAMGEDDLGT